MRTDTNLPESFRQANEWEANRYDQSLFYGRYSFSGNERNHLFINQGGRQFDDVAPLSGLDTKSDSRSFGYLDFDRDGWQDIALVNANAPLFTLYRNRMGDADNAGVIAVRFVGANHTDQPAPGKTARNGYGAVVEVELGDMTLKREHRCGEGFAAQNSATMLIGVAGATTIDAVTVRWPNGRTQRIENVAEGAMLTAYEDPGHAPSGEPFVVEPYRTSEAGELRTAARDRLNLGDPVASDVKMYMAMATWCTACKASMPQLNYLRASYNTDQFQMIGVPIDPNDDPDKLRDYMNNNRPPYGLLANMSDDQRTHFTDMLAKGHAHSTPATILTDADGNVLAAMPGVPTISDIAKAMHQARPGP